MKDILAWIPKNRTIVERCQLGDTNYSKKEKTTRVILIAQKSTQTIIAIKAALLVVIGGQEKGMQTMTVKQIIAAYLKENGYDGLYDGDECGCSCDINELMCCNDICRLCEPGYFFKCTMEHCSIIHIGPKKEMKDV